MSSILTRQARARKVHLKKHTFRYRPAFDLLEGRVAPAVITVNAVADNTTSDSELTLREGILIANGTLGRALSSDELAQVNGALGGSNTIQFSLPAGAQTIALTGGALDITSPLAINGPGASNLTITANGASRDFVVGTIFSRNLALVVSMSGFSVAGGSATAGTTNYGGGLLNFGTLTLNNLSFSGNAAGSSGGGAIYNVGSLAVSNSTFTANSSSNSGSGAGILNISSGLLTVTNCTFSANTTSNGSSGAAIANSGAATVTTTTFDANISAATGGGIYNSSEGKLTISQSTFSNNRSGSDGGGIDNDGTLTVSGSTFVGNSAASEGGGVESGNTMTMIDCTVVGNTASSRGGGIEVPGPGLTQIIHCTITGNRAGSANGGGGVFNEVAPQLFNTIVTGNFEGAAPSTTAGDISGAVDAISANNLIGIGGSGGLANNVNGNQVGVANAGLGTLASNGGLTQTIALLPGSPAIDRGGNAQVPAGITDQRGLVRIVHDTVDIGALEVQTTATAPANQTAVVGAVTSLNLGSFADANNAGGPWSVIVNWGDNSSNTSFSTSTQGPLGTRTHTYAATGTFTVTVTVADVNHDTSVATFQIEVTAPVVIPPIVIPPVVIPPVVIPPVVIPGPGVITVNSVADTTAADAALTLREAILVANGTLGRALSAGEQAQITGTLGNTNTIQFSLPAGLQTITLTNGALTISKNVTINGPGATLLRVSGNDASRVFVVGAVYRQDLSLNVSISGLTVANGKAVTGPNNYGGGLLNFGTLSLNNMAFTGNAAGSSGGGGIFTFGALTVTNSTFAANSSTSLGAGAGILNVGSARLIVSNCSFTGNNATKGSSGAGIANSGLATVSNSTFSGNTAASNGGGVYNSISGTLVITACTFANNTSNADGGGLKNDGTAVVNNSTFANNYANSEGGGVESAGPLMLLSNCTLAGNSAGTRGGGIQNAGPILLTNCTVTGNRAPGGGGLYCETPATLFNSIVAGNLRGSASSNSSNDVAGTVDSVSANNLIGTGGSGGLANGVRNNQVGVSNAKLGALADNGGPTQTIALLAGSPAINKGNNALIPVGGLDQRGLTRVVNGTVDIGAFEQGALSATPSTPGSIPTILPDAASAGIHLFLQNHYLLDAALENWLGQIWKATAGKSQIFKGWF